MQKFMCIGRLTKDVELSTTSNGIQVARFSIAVDRKFKKEDGTHDTDFFNVTAWRGLANTLAEYCQKGSKIYLAGELQNNVYEAQDGTKRYDVQIVASEVEFLNTKPNGNTTEQPKADLQPVEESDLPF